MRGLTPKFALIRVKEMMNMKKILIIVALLSILVVGCSEPLKNRNIQAEIDLTECLEKKTTFSDCRKDFHCYVDSFSEWSRLADDRAGLSCGLILYEGQQMFLGDDDGFVSRKINYCDTTENIIQELEKNNITKYELIKIWYYDDKDGTTFSHSDILYNVSSCFITNLFIDDYDNVSKFVILDECKQEVGVT